MGEHRGEDAGGASEGDGQRLDKWLWFARVVKSRTLAAQLVQDGKVRVNRVRAAKSSQTVRPGDVLTIAIRGRVLVVRVREPGARRGPPATARLLYEALEELGGAGGRPPRPSRLQPEVRHPPRHHQRRPDRSGEPE